MKKLFIYLSIILCLSACCKDQSEVIPGQDFIPDEILAEIEDNGQPIHEGFNPPNLSGSYLISPLILVESNFPDSNTSGSFADERITFYDFDENDLTIKVDYTQASSSGQGLGSFVSGEGNNFTVYVELNAERTDGTTYLLTKVISGTLQENGIQDVSLSVFMIDDNGDPNDVLIENGQGRRFKDGNDFSDKI